MPELPEVELQCRYLLHTSLHKRVKKVGILDDYVIKGVSGKEFSDQLEEAQFEGAARRGKFIEVTTDGESDVAIHLGMTSHLTYTPTYSTLHKYTRVIFSFTNNSDLRYISKRKLGGLYLVPKGEFTQIPAIREMGPEPLDPQFDLPTFRRMTNSRSAMVKALILDQRFVAGIGNIYADEILFQAAIRPDRKICTLTENELVRLHTEMKKVLQTALQLETRFENSGSFLIPHRDKGEDCPRCGAPIQRIKISNRTSYYCNQCQK